MSFTNSEKVIIKFIDKIADPKDLIYAVKNYPAIWNYTAEEYANKVERKNAWRQVILKFIPDYDDRPQIEKNIIVAAIQKKWKGIRTCYNREVSKQKKEQGQSVETGRKQYVYFEILRFLEASSQQGTGNMEGEEIVVNVSLDDVIEGEDEDKDLDLQNEERDSETRGYCPAYMSNCTPEKSSIMKLIDRVVDPEDLICEVEKNPAVWKIAAEEYGSKIERKNAWHDIIIKFIQDFDDRPQVEKNEIVAIIQKKWKGIRTCYNREVQKQKKEKGLGPTGRKQYVYFDMLRFLETASHQGSVGEEIIVNVSLDGIEDDMGLDLQKKDKDNSYRQFRKRSCNEDEELMQVLKKKIFQEGESSSGENDEDRLFLLSLTSELHKVPTNRKLKLKSEIIDAISKAQQPYQQWPQQMTPPTYPGHPPVNNFSFMPGPNIH